MKVNYYFVVGTIPSKEKDTEQFQKVIRELNGLGLDIGKGDADYGYKMPLPKKDESIRELRVFRRWKDD